MFEFFDDTLISEPLIEHGVDEETNEAGKPGYFAARFAVGGGVAKVEMGRFEDGRMGR